MTLRTLRYYDRVGLLSPSQHTEAGYRLYAEEDLLTLQHILALKFLGFSLDEIKRCLRREPEQFEAALARQKEMLLDRRRQLDAILAAIERAQERLRAGQRDWGAIVRVIKEIQMQQKQEWVKKYFSDEQLQKLEELSQTSYSPEARQKLAQRGVWTEEDQARASAQWEHVFAESQRLAAAGADPAGEEAQAVAQLKSELLFSFTQGDPDIEAGLGRFWESHNALTKEEQPLAHVVPTANDAGADFLNRAMEIYQQRQQNAG